MKLLLILLLLSIFTLLTPFVLCGKLLLITIEWVRVIHKELSDVIKA